jgi:putative PIG3 family NAD(P)H quinone oxidoreductase
MRAVDIKDGKGPLENLYIDDSTPKPQAGNGQLLVKIAAFALNRMDIMQREGKYPLPPQAGPIMGVEFAGIVEEKGSGCSDAFKVGDAVFGLAYGGAYAEYIAVSEVMCIHKPAQFDMVWAASLPEVWFTAIQALHLVGEMPREECGMNVLIHAGASGVGLAAIQLAKKAGAKRIFATAGRDTKLELCRSVGATKAINYKTEDFGEVIRGTLPEGEGIDFVLDFIGKDYWEKNISLAARDATIVYLAMMSGSQLQVDLMPILFKRLTIRGTTLRSRDAGYQGKLRDLFCELALDKLVNGLFKSHIDKVYPMEQIRDAQERMQTNAGDGGKIVCEVKQ